MWFPVVLTYSFSGRELKNDPLTTLRAELEQLDIKFLTDYNARATTHVVSKKRNTSKGLQALINGKYIVTSTFTDSIVAGATVQDGEESPLEQNFDAAWPNALDHLPPRGAEATQSPSSHYAPDPARQNVFSGYTFIFYDKAQWENLLGPITNGQGKALHREVVAHETEVDDFVDYVKSTAGKKGLNLNSFNDDSTGKGVVVVRYLPAKGGDVDWYADFITAVSIQLNHRSIEQKEFLEAILVNDASILRRPLPVDSQPQEPDSPRTPRRSAREPSTDVNMAEPTTSVRGVSQEPSQSQSQNLAPLRRSRVRRPATKRFKGFDDDDDDGIPDVKESVSSVLISETALEEPQQAPAEEEEGLFVSQGSVMASQESEPPQRPTRKRRGPPIHDEDEVMDDIAPTAAAAKRRRIARGEEAVLREPSVEPMDEEVEPKPAAKPKKIKKEIDVLEVARKTREEAEAKARAEQEDLNNVPEDIDLAEIRKLAIVEEMPVRTPASARTREQDIADGRWDPRWNGRKNFKRFRPRGEVTGRPLKRVIVRLEQVKTKEFGIGDDYWLEDEEAPRESQVPLSQASRGSESQARQNQVAPRGTNSQLRRQAARRTVSDDSAEEEDTGQISLGISELEQSSSRLRSSRASQRTAESQAGIASTRASTKASTQKRAATQLAVEQPAKRVRSTRRAAVAAESEDSDDEVGFRFGRRR